MQGFATYPEMQHHNQYSCFSVARNGRSHNQMTEQAGNSMHQHVIGASLMYAYSFVEMPTSLGKRFLGQGPDLDRDNVRRQKTAR